MNSSHSNSEKGQAIVYLVLGLVVFLGFVALAIDGGMALANRRHAQNSADAASLAGGAAVGFYLEDHRFDVCTEDWDCFGDAVGQAEGDAIAQAVSRAGMNGFTIEEDADLADHNGVNTKCGGDSFDNGYIDVTVAISATSPSNFMQLVYPKALHNEVGAVTRVYSGGPYLFGDAVVALNNEECSDPGSSGVIVGGSGTLHVTGGDVFSNGCVRQNSEISVTIDAPNNALGSSLFKSDDWADLTTEEIQTSEYEIPQPDCTTAPADHNIGGHAFPSTLEPGLWCVTGDVSLNQSATLDATGVTIVMLTGKFVINGPADVHLSAPCNTCDTVDGAIRSLLIYLPKTNTNDVILNGNEESNFSGLVYAPKSTIKMNGTGSNIYNPSQIVGLNVVVEGTGDLSIIYKGCQGYLRSPRIELYK